MPNYFKVTVVTICFLVCFVESKKLKLVSSVEISTIGEPSGIAFCHSTNTLWIADDSSNAISETDLHGNLLTSWYFEAKHHHDPEGITCDDINQKIYIALEKNMDIISFVLPILGFNNTYTVLNDGTLQLIELERVYVDIEDLRVPEDDDGSLAGLEGLTWIPITNSLIAANEKEPPLILSVATNGNVLNTEPFDCEDLSGIAFDEELNILWIISDREERIYATDITGRYIFDSWEIPSLHHPEGVIVDNNSSPPMIYIVTDPLSPHGKPFISGFFKFLKPDISFGNLQETKECPSNSSSDSSQIVQGYLIFFVIFLATCVTLLCVSLVVTIRLYIRKKNIIPEEEWNDSATKNTSIYEKVFSLFPSRSKVYSPVSTSPELESE